MENSKKVYTESLMMSHAYASSQGLGAIKSPIFQTSSFVFPTAEIGKAYFEVAYGLREKAPNEDVGMIYSRLSNPNLETVEDRLRLWDHAEACAVFVSGMAAVSTTLIELLEAGDLLLYSTPLYGGSMHFIEHILPQYGIHVLGFHPEMSKEEILDLIYRSGKADRLKAIYTETPANPTNALVDLSCCREIASEIVRKDQEEVYLIVDNTFMGPLWQHPLEFGADLVIYSATKYLGGHSDLIAGACLGRASLIERIKNMRTFVGNMASPWTSWLLMRSLETLKVRMEQQAANAARLADYLEQHPCIQKVNYLGLLQPEDGKAYQIFRRQCTSGGAMISFEIEGGEEEAFRFLNHLKLIKLAVSLGSTESLAQHPSSMTHAGLSREEKIRFDIKDNLIRLSVGIEHIDDLIADIDEALKIVSSRSPIRPVAMSSVYP